MPLQLQGTPDWSGDCSFEVNSVVYKYAPSLASLCIAHYDAKHYRLQNQYKRSLANVCAKRKNGDTKKPLKDDHTIFEFVKSLYKGMARTRGIHGFLLGLHEEDEEEKFGIHKEEEIGIQYEEEDLGIREDTITKCVLVHFRFH